MSVDYSVVVPVCNEAENVEPLAREIDAALRGRAYEMIFVDDGSTDETAANLRALKQSLPALRVLRHSFRSGQSAAVATELVFLTDHCSETWSPRLALAGP